MQENIRNLFADAKAEMQSKGDESELHVIILDEIDAICRQVLCVVRTCMYRITCMLLYVTLNS